MYKEEDAPRCAANRFPVNKLWSISMIHVVVMSTMFTR